MSGTGRARLEQVRRPEADATADEGHRAGAPPAAPVTPQDLLTLQRSVGNQAATAVLARMGDDKDDDDEGGGGFGAYLYSWLTYFTGYWSSPAPAATSTTDTAPATQTITQEPVATQPAAPVIAQVAPVQAPPPPPPATAPPAPAPLSAYERADLRTAERKLSDLVPTLTDPTLRGQFRRVCTQIEGVLAAQTVTDSAYTGVHDAIRDAWTALEEARKKAAEASATQTETSQATATATVRRPVHVVFGTAIGADEGDWGDYGEVVARVVDEMRNDRVTFGPDHKPQLALSVKGHWQQGEGQHFIKVYLDAEDMGGGTRIRGYFRYRIFHDRVVIKFVAIRREHSGKNTTLLGNHEETIGADGS
jgi:hypothetical protein